MYRIAYCSNVHAGATLAETQRNLARYAVEVKQRFSPHQTMGVGLWLSNQAAVELASAPAKRDEFRDFLQESGLETFTFNGFPFGNFHQRVVKHAVYQPTWFDETRLKFTRRLVDFIQFFCGEGDTSISTLPIAWGSPQPSVEELSVAAGQIRKLAADLVAIRNRTGRETFICIEPEPGCFIQTSKDVVGFFEDYLLRGSSPKLSEADIRRHVRVCHDVCHSVVMCEAQADVLATYREAGVRLGKVQISSAVCVDFDQLSADDRTQAFAELSDFAEDRYLHQTTIEVQGQPPTFYEDLPKALNTVGAAKQARGNWRIHFHVPVYLEGFGKLQASRQAIVDFMKVCRQHSDVEHFEVETYAWNVLPRELQKQALSEGIAEELTWFKSIAEQYLS